MATTATEREVKLSVPDAWQLPDLSAVRGVQQVDDAGEHRLVATYHDTTDLRLLRARATFRRRLGGTDAGWHVKLPGESSGLRIEVRREHKRPPRTPPADLVAVLTARTRGAVLAPVMELVTVRHVRHLVADGEVLAEVADDRVTATGPDGVTERWREIEVELLDGSTSLLNRVVKVLVKAGADPAAGPSKLATAIGPVPPAREQVARPRSLPGLVLAYLRDQVDALVDADARVRLDLPEGVHDLRVASRRLRSALATHGRLLDADLVDHLRAELKALAAAGSAARDAEVLVERLPVEVATLPAELQAQGLAEGLAEHLDERLRTARAELLAELAGERYLALLEDLEALVAGDTLPEPGPGGSDPRGATASVRHDLRRIRRAIGAAGQVRGTDALPPALHEVRKAAKRARYAAELVAPKVGDKAEDLAERLANLQDLLGLYQDDVVAQHRLRELAAAPDTATGTSFALGALHERVTADPDGAYRSARKAVRRAARGWPS